METLVLTPDPDESDQPDPVRLDRLTWREVERLLESRPVALLPAGSTEQHGPIGVIGTDALCATAVAEWASGLTGAVVAPALAYAPAPFNMGFPGTVSIPETLFGELAAAVVDGLLTTGFEHVLVVNGHGANLAPLRRVARTRAPRVHLCSWWEDDEVSDLRRALFGAWEGMHATPSEISIVETLHRTVPRTPEAEDPPRALERAWIEARAGDRHGPPDEHRASFPDGRVGSHSALASPGAGHRLLRAAGRAVAEAVESIRAGTRGVADVE